MFSVKGLYEWRPKTETAYDSVIVAHVAIGTVMSLMIARGPRQSPYQLLPEQPRHRMLVTGDHQDSATLPCQADSSVCHLDHRPFVLRPLAPFNPRNLPPDAAETQALFGP